MAIFFFFLLVHFFFSKFYPSLPPYFQNFRSSSFGDEQKFPEWLYIKGTSLTLFEVDVTGLPVNIEVTRLQSLSRRPCDWGTVLKPFFEIAIFVSSMYGAGLTASFQFSLCVTCWAYRA